MFPPEVDDPLRPLIFAVEQARAAQRLSKIINRIKRVDETDEQALIRVIQERMFIGQILTRLGIQPEQFDETHRNTNIVNELTKLFVK